MKKIKDLINKLDNKQLILIVLVFLVIVYLDFSLLIGGQLQGNKNMSSKITKLSNDINKLRQDSKKMADLKKEFASGGNKPESKIKKMVLEQEITSLFQYIAEIAKGNNIQLARIRPAKSSSEQSTRVDKRQAAKYTPYLINLELISGFHELGKFINDLERGDIFIEILNFKINPQSNDTLKQSVNLGLETYVTK